jgi:hypothetical protein
VTLSVRPTYRHRIAENSKAGGVPCRGETPRTRASNRYHGGIVAAVAAGRRDIDRDDLRLTAPPRER